MNPCAFITQGVIMGFTVTRDGGTKDNEFEAYARLLRQQGVDLGRLPRVPEPGTNRRWLYVWDTHAQAQAFADELKKRTRDPAWQVIQVSVPSSEGPLGPVLIQLARRGDGLIFAVHSLSQAMIRSAFPAAFGVHTVSIDTQRWDDFRKSGGTLADLVRQIAPTLTGLSDEQLGTLGYAVIDDQSKEALVSVSPAEAAQV
jgi:hypothetical protein